jgi:hypothetical protein
MKTEHKIPLIITVDGERVLAEVRISIGKGYDSIEWHEVTCPRPFSDEKDILTIEDLEEDEFERLEGAIWDLFLL